MNKIINKAHKKITAKDFEAGKAYVLEHSIDIKNPWIYFPLWKDDACWHSTLIDAGKSKLWETRLNDQSKFIEITNLNIEATI